MTKMRSTEDVIAEFKIVHGDMYDYSEFEYGGIRTLGIVICPEHGKFEVTPINHRRGSKCPICSETFKDKCKRLGVDYYRAMGGESGGSNKQPKTVDGIDFPGAREAALYIAETRNISYEGAIKKWTNRYPNTFAPG